MIGEFERWKIGEAVETWFEILEMQRTGLLEKCLTSEDFHWSNAKFRWVSLVAEAKSTGRNKPKRMESMLRITQIEFLWTTKNKNYDLSPPDFNVSLNMFPRISKRNAQWRIGFPDEAHGGTLCGGLEGRVDAIGLVCLAKMLGLVASNFRSLQNWTVFLSIGLFQDNCLLKIGLCGFWFFNRMVARMSQFFRYRPYIYIYIYI